MELRLVRSTLLAPAHTLLPLQVTAEVTSWSHFIQKVTSQQTTTLKSGAGLNRRSFQDGVVSHRPPLGKRTSLNKSVESVADSKSCGSILTPHVSEVNGLSVGVEQLDNRVVVVLHPAADDGHLPLHHRHVLRHQVLTHHWAGRETRRERSLNRPQTQTGHVIRHHDTDRKCDTQHEDHFLLETIQSDVCKTLWWTTHQLPNKPAG